MATRKTEVAKTKEEEEEAAKSQGLLVYERKLRVFFSTEVCSKRNLLEKHTYSYIKESEGEPVVYVDVQACMQKRV